MQGFAPGIHVFFFSRWQDVNVEDEVPMAPDRAITVLRHIPRRSRKLGVLPLPFLGGGGLPVAMVDPNPLSHSFMLQKRVALSPPGRGRERR